MPTHVLIETHDHAEMTETMRSVYGSGLRMGRARGDLAFHQEVFLDDGITMGNMSIGAEMGVGQEGFADWAIARLRAGKYTFHGRDELDIARGQTFLMPPVIKLRAHIDTPRLDVVQISPTEILRTILDLYPFARASSPAAVTPVSREAAAAWWATAEAYAQVLQTPELYENDLVRRTGWQHLLGLSVQVFGLVRERPDHSSGERIVRRAEAYIEDNLDQPLTLPAVAAAVAVSPRTLQAAFREYRDTTPMNHIRRARLHAAQRDLRNADPEVATVARIAARWGFQHPSRFAAYYRAEFATDPGADLNR
ncbi:helix-turn-helix domain-containing protein [Microbacterium sp. AZCO]|uniref:helix-turn-helix domain-containing protein n=1 Tax=Microbacterium sp. AZCO TaxID=3142976 RepID=UPI0031F44095